MANADRNLLDVHCPPVISRKVRCAHCEQEYSSAEMQWHAIDDAGAGYWKCPTEACVGRGFGFDIFPVTEVATDSNWSQHLHEQAKDHDLYL